MMPARTRRGLSSLAQCVERVAGPSLRRRGFAESAIVTRWPEIVGRPLCDHTRPSRVIFPRGKRREGTLHLMVTGAFATEVQHLSPQIIARINGYFGFEAINRLNLHHGEVGRTTPPGPGAQAFRATAETEAEAEAEAEARLAPDLRRLIGTTEDDALRRGLLALALARGRREGKS